MPPNEASEGNKAFVDTLSWHRTERIFHFVMISIVILARHVVSGHCSLCDSQWRKWNQNENNSSFRHRNEFNLFINLMVVRKDEYHSSPVDPLQRRAFCFPYRNAHSPAPSFLRLLTSCTYFITFNWILSKRWWIINAIERRVNNTYFVNTLFNTEQYFIRFIFGEWRKRFDETLEPFSMQSPFGGICEVTGSEKDEITLVFWLRIDIMYELMAFSLWFE